MSDIGEKIKDVRKKAGRSQVEFAASLEITQGFLSAIENGKNQPTAEFLTRMANIYQTDINWLLTGKESAPQIQKDIPTTKAESAIETASNAHFDALHAVKGMELLTKIYTSGDTVFIRAINANLLAFSDAIENRSRAEITTNAIREMREQMKTMNGKISILEQENHDLRQKILSSGDREQKKAAG